MSKVKKSSIAKSTTVEKSIVSSVDTLSTVYQDVDKAVSVRSIEVKKINLLGKRLSKKRASLLKRKKSLTVKNKKDPNAENKKALKEIEKELGVVKKESVKVKAQKEGASSELASLKDNLKRVAAYVKVIRSTDKVLSKPKKKSRPAKRKAVKEAA